MRNRKLLLIRLILVIMSISLVIAGCNTNGKGSEKKAEKSKAGNETTSRVEESKVKGETTPKVGDKFERREMDNNIPDSLDDIKDDAEDIVEDTTKEDWTEINEKLSSIERNWSLYETMAKEKKVSKGEIDKFIDDLNNLKKEVKDKKTYETKLAANRLAITSTDFMKLYERKFLVDIEKIELYGKQILFTAEHDDWEQSKVELKSAMKIWNEAQMEADKIDPNITKKVSDIMINISDAIDAKDNKKIKEIYEVLDDELDKLEDRFRI